jgi:hypothetical protein
MFRKYASFLNKYIETKVDKIISNMLFYIKKYIKKYVAKKIESEFGLY